MDKSIWQEWKCNEVKYVGSDWYLQSLSWQTLISFKSSSKEILTKSGHGIKVFWKHSLCSRDSGSIGANAVSASKNIASEGQ